MQSVRQNEVWECAVISSKTYADPFNEITVDLLVKGPDGAEVAVPAFWAGGSMWKARFSSPTVGVYECRTRCSDTSDGDLHDVRAKLTITPYTGDNPLYAHGRIQAAPDSRHFEHRDGTPFFWLGDTWWMGLTKRLEWPAGFQELTMDRVAKGFNVVQIVAGLYPDMPPFDERGLNESGFPWERDLSKINPEYFDYADRRIRYMVEMGLVPCIVACWGYYLSYMGIDAIKKHWRNLIARWGAYPVAWCLAGEAKMPFYLSEDKENDAARQKVGWTELAEYVKDTDPFGTAITIHPGDHGRDQINDPSLLSFDMLQTGHSDRLSLSSTLDTVSDAYAKEPIMPFINSEVCYEGIGEACRQEVQRLMFWSSVLNGAAGHTYGANGIWQVNTREKPYGPSPHGMSWGDLPWEEAYQLPGSAHVALGKRILEKLEWQSFEPHLEWVSPCWTKSDQFMSYYAPSAAGIPGKVRVIYMPSFTWSLTVKSLEEDLSYHAYLVSPIDGHIVEVGNVTGDANGEWELALGNPPWKMMPIFQDWVLILEAIE